MFRLFVSTAARFCDARGLASATAFGIDYARAAPWASRWTALIDRFCRRRFGTAAPLDLIRAGLTRPDGISHGHRVSRLRAHYDIIDSYFTDTAAVRMVFEQAVPMAVAAGEGGCVYQMDILTPPAHMRGEGELMLAFSHYDGIVAALPFRFGYTGGNRLALRLGRMHVAADAARVEADLYGLPVRAAVMDGVYAMVRTLGVTELTAELDATSDVWRTFMGDCAAAYVPGGRFSLPLEAQFWQSDAGRAALGPAWVPQQMVRAEIMSQANAAVASWLRYDETAARRAHRRVAIGSAAK